MTPEPPTAARRWSEGLAAWALPEEVLAQAPVSPWGFPPDLFAEVTRSALAAPPTPTHLRCLEALPEGGSVLDVGAGGGAASLPLAPRPARVVAVDRSAALLEVMSVLATVELEPVQGSWPQAAADVAPADVVVCANVAYDVADLAPFLVALTGRATRRVVLELTAVHPQAWLSPLWQHFWGLERPTGPVAADALDLVREAVGVEPETQTWTRPHPLSEHHQPDQVARVRRRLCLTEAADAELARLLPELPSTPIGVVTAWWAPPAA